MGHTLFNIRTQILSAMFLCLGTIGAIAEELPQPVGEPILVVSGLLSNTNSDDAARIDLDMLKNLPQSEFSTDTIWTDEVNTFVGVSLYDLVKFLGVTGTTISAIAINDYAIEIPVSDAVEGGPIIAYLMDGEELSARDKGPLWIIYPFDDNEDYRNEQIYSRSIWQLDRIEIFE